MTHSITSGLFRAGIVGLSLLQPLGQPEVTAQCQVAKILASDAEPEIRFGTSVAIDGDLMLSAASNFENVGAVYVLRFDPDQRQWVEEAKLVASDGQTDDRFGQCVAIEGSIAVIGAPNDDDLGENAGAAYVFRYDSKASAWVQESKLLPGTPVTNSNFGVTVDCSGDVIVVGGTPFNGSGSAYVYRFDSTTSSWVQEAQLLPAVPSANDRFGYAVAISENRIAVSASGDYDGVEGAGAVHVFDYIKETGSWSASSVLTADPPTESTFLGSSLALDGEAVLAGSAQYPALAGCGDVVTHPFRFNPDKSTWDHQQVISPSLNAEACIIWLSPWLAVKGNTAVIGDTIGGNGSGQIGSLHVYHYDATTKSWLPGTVLMAADQPAPYTGFGRNVAISNGVIVAGARLDNDGGVAAGAAYVFAAGDDCNENFQCDDVDIATGASFDTNANGIPDECEAGPGDVNNDGVVNVDDLLAVINGWGECPAPPTDCIADLNANGVVDVDDLLIVINHWGP